MLYLSDCIHCPWRADWRQVLRKDFMCQQKQWQEDLAQSAPSDPAAPEDEESEARTENGGSEGSTAAACDFGAYADVSSQSLTWSTKS